jgi:hypothetical protein
LLFDAPQFAVRMKMRTDGPTHHYIDSIGLRFMDLPLFFDTHPRPYGYLEALNARLSARASYLKGNRDVLLLDLCPDMRIKITNMRTTQHRDAIPFLNIGERVCLLSFACGHWDMLQSSTFPDATTALVVCSVGFCSELLRPSLIALPQARCTSVDTPRMGSTGMPQWRQRSKLIDYEPPENTPPASASTNM